MATFMNPPMSNQIIIYDVVNFYADWAVLDDAARRECVFSFIYFAFI